MDLLDKLRKIEQRRAKFVSGSAAPGMTVIEGVLGPSEVVIGGRPTLMFGSNNYLGLTTHPAVISAATDALQDYGTGTTGSRTANGTLALHEGLEEEFADWFGKQYATIFSTGYQANLSLIGALCGAGDVILIDGDSHASIYDATRQTASQVIGFRHNSPESLQKKLERLPRGQRNRLVVVEGLYSIRGDVAPLREIADVCGMYGAYLLVDEAHSLGTYGATGLGCAEDQGVLDRVDFIVGTFSKSLAGIGGVCVSIIPSFGRCTSWRARTFLRRQGPRRTWPACAPQSAWCARTRSCAISSGRTSGVCGGDFKSAGKSSATPNPRSSRFSRATKTHHRPLAAALARRAVREPHRPARLPQGRMRSPRELLGGAHTRAHRTCARIFSRVGVELGATVAS